MQSSSRLLTVITIFGATALLSAEDNRAAKPIEPRESAIGRRIPNVVLPDLAGKQVGLADFKDKQCLVIAFLGTQCPVGNAYLPALLDLQKRYADKQVQVIGINAVPGDSAEAIAKHAKEFGITFPVLIDAEQTALHIFG